MRLWESIIHNYFEEQKVAEVLGKQKNSRKDIVGAYVHAPASGSLCVGGVGGCDVAVSIDHDAEQSQPRDHRGHDRR
jgi:hypothetical protein